MKTKHIFLSFIITIALFDCFSQKEANIWYFNEHAGLDFNGGQPQKLPSIIEGNHSSASISDDDGNFLFTSDGERVYNRNLQLMKNGDDLLGGINATAGVIIIQKPDSDNLYYVLTAPAYNYPPGTSGGLYYSVVDMTLDDGLGAVTNEKNIPLEHGWDVMEKLTTVRHSNGEDIWLICYKQKEIKYASFLITPSGIVTEPVLNDTPPKLWPHLKGIMKVSYDKKYFVSADHLGGKAGDYPFDKFCINQFNATSGEVTFMYAVYLEQYPPSSSYQVPFSVEFSPDSKHAYFGTWAISHENDDELESRVYQFDMSLIEDSVQFVESAMLISHNGGSGLQLATDGKIYCRSNVFENSSYYPINVIHFPEKRGANCDFEENYFEYPIDQGAKWNFPNILLDHLYRFEWEGHCSADPFYFQSNFQPEPAFIEWHFSDPLSGSNISHDINPVHTFSAGGEFEVSVYVEYPNGRIEETSRVVTVTKTPKPDLGPDILKCEDEEIVLNAGNETGFYSWSTGSFGQDANEITVSDTGTYWVRVENEDCVGYDTIYVGLYPKAEIKEDNLQLIPTACGGSIGKILGLEIIGTEPLSYEWYDGDDNLIGTTLNITDLTVGNYFLHILDGNGCTTISDAYTIFDIGDIEISEIEKENTHCGQGLGNINITASSGSSGDLLYSIDNGNTWQTADNSFEDLLAGNYFVRVKDQSGCEVVYENNPVVIESIDGPEVISATASPEIDYLSNGEIDISAVVSSGNVFYSIDNGNTFQLDAGKFTNLTEGIYTCQVKDNFGCDTTFVVEVELILSQLIEAIAGDGYTCIGNAAVVPLKLNNFTDIFKFNVKLTYDTAILNCDGYMQVHPLLEDNILVSIVPGTDEVIVAWQGGQATTLEDNATMLELVFGAKGEGFSNIDWAALPGESVFYNEQLQEISTDYHFGSLRIYTRPEIMMFDQQQKCVGDELIAFPFVNGGTGQLSYEWTGPNNFYSTNDLINIQNLEQQNAGIYYLTVTDTVDCEENAEVTVTVHDNPQINFPTADTIFEQHGFVLDAGGNYQYYLWNTGDTTSSIAIDIEGLYSVLINTAKGCKSSDSITIMF
ncbi:MAG: hypothetical protein DRI54_06070, partial [Bacteroidetes bacterium]